MWYEFSIRLLDVNLLLVNEHDELKRNCFYYQQVIFTGNNKKIIFFLIKTDIYTFSRISFYSKIFDIYVYI